MPSSTLLQFFVPDGNHTAGHMLSTVGVLSSRQRAQCASMLFWPETTSLFRPVALAAECGTAGHQMRERNERLQLAMCVQCTCQIHRWPELLRTRVTAELSNWL
jgi:hypothetical protein